MEEIVIDGSGKVLGRLASSVAKMLLEGKRVALLNAEKILISGSKSDIIKKYKARIELKDKANPEHSPYWSRRPDLFAKRVIRGMLPYKKARGKSAYRLLRVYIGIPSAYANARHVEIGGKNPKEMHADTLTIGSLMRLLGYKG
ncbi:MAG: 50S ribosomal protein L13 [Candidatus Micrarchaeaceae archaeon]